MATFCAVGVLVPVVVVDSFGGFGQLAQLYLRSLNESMTCPTKMELDYYIYDHFCENAGRGHSQLHLHRKVKLLLLSCHSYRQWKLSFGSRSRLQAMEQHNWKDFAVLSPF